MPLHANYSANLAEAKEFEDFVFDTLQHERKLIIGGYRHRHYQVMHGESMTGVEVKLDRSFRSTGNLFIETQERPSVSAAWKPAGIYHESQPWLIVIGDYSTFWVFAAKTLVNYHEHCGCGEMTNRSDTGQGFLLPVEKADKHCAMKWEG